MIVFVAFLLWFFIGIPFSWFVVAPLIHGYKPFTTAGQAEDHRERGDASPYADRKWRK